MKFLNKGKLRSYILSVLDEAEIFAYYLRTDVSEIHHCINNKQYRIVNTIRGESNASFGLQYVSSNTRIKLYGKDFANPMYTGDCFQLAGLALGLHCNNPRDFVIICQHIIANIIQDDKRDLVLASHPPVILLQNNIRDIKVWVRDWNIHDIKYWAQYGITPEYLNRELIFPLKDYTIDGAYQSYFYSKDDPCYGYYLGFDKVNLWEIYRPYADKTVKFRTNNFKDVKELHLVKPHSLLLLTKAKKEKALINKILNDLGIRDTQVLYTSESGRIRIDTRSIFSSNYKHVAVNFDLDRPGLSAMKYCNNEYGYKLFPFTSATMIKHIADHPKDITDFCKRFGYDATKRVFEHLYNKLLIQ